ncbi:MAG: hypothetical protein UZ07_CHB004001187 [Chlorobi bacterium OLB7]|nr:MAG: hypothetical protein UZ07_CHB004001187 [Chlorobi bacterium OLB7]
MEEPSPQALLLLLCVGSKDLLGFVAKMFGDKDFGHRKRTHGKPASGVHLREHKRGDTFGTQSPGNDSCFDVGADRPNNRPLHLLVRHDQFINLKLAAAVWAGFYTIRNKI